MSLTYRSTSCPAVLFCLALIFSLLACSDDPEPRDPDGNGGPGIGGGATPDDDAGLQDPADADTGDDVDDGDAGQLCELLPTDAHSDFRFPCCFEDEDCHESDAPNAELMVCYNATCEEGGEGTCRVPPTEEGRCWADSDCPEGQRCPFGNLYEQYRCTNPNIQEIPRTCIDE